jgi:hypothetical protein
MASWKLGRHFISEASSPLALIYFQHFFQSLFPTLCVSLNGRQRVKNIHGIKQCCFWKSMPNLTLISLDPGLLLRNIGHHLSRFLLHQAYKTERCFQQDVFPPPLLADFDSCFALLNSRLTQLRTFCIRNFMKINYAYCFFFHVKTLKMSNIICPRIVTLDTTTASVVGLTGTLCPAFV